MKSMLLGCLTAITIGVAGASAQSATDKTPTGAVNPAPSAAAPATPAPDPAVSATPDQKDAFITKQAPGTMRAPKLVGVAVYDSNNKSVGKIDDLLLNHDGEIETVVVGVGGFLGIGSKDVGVPYSAIHWQTEQRKAPVTAPTPGGALGQTPATKTIDPAATEAYQGYPDKAVLEMTQAQLKAAPEFKYAEDPAAQLSSAATDKTAAPTPPQKP